MDRRDVPTAKAQVEREYSTQQLCFLKRTSTETRLTQEQLIFLLHRFSVVPNLSNSKFVLPNLSNSPHMFRLYLLYNVIFVISEFSM